MGKDTGTKAHFLVVCRQFLLILWKNFLLQIRRPIGTFFELSLPPLAAIVLIALRFGVFAPEDRCFATFNSDSLTVPLPNNTYQIYYTPITDNTTRIAECIRQALPYADVTGVASEEELVGNLTDMDVPVPMFLTGRVNNRTLRSEAGCFIRGAGIVFDDLDGSDDSLEYTLRLRHEVGEDNTWNTIEAAPTFQRVGPRVMDNVYLSEGFVHLESIVGEAIIRLMANPDMTDCEGMLELNISVSMKQLPYPEYRVDLFLTVAGITLPLLLILAYIYSAGVFTKELVLEKETRIRESMLMMGLQQWVLWTTWFLKQFIVFFISGLLLSILLKVGQVFPKTDFLILLIFVTLFIISGICFCFLLSVWFNTARVGLLVGFLGWFLSYIPTLFVPAQYDTLSLGGKIAFCILSNTCVGLGINTISLLEIRGEGVQWSNLAEPISLDDTFHLGYVFMMLILDSIVYMLIAWYVNAVKPGQYGVPKPFYFPFLPSYWLGRPLISKMKDAQQLVQSTGGGYDNAAHEEEPKDMPVGISIRNLTKVYDESLLVKLLASHETKAKQRKVAVNELNLNMYEGQITALLGHNGAGKTTTMSILTGLYTPTGGTAVINGYDIRSNMDQIRQNLGICPQHDVLFDRLTVLEHLKLFGRLKGLGGKALQEEADSMIEDLKLQDKRNTPSSSLSGGMKRKLSVGIALIGGSKIVVLDEPTSGIDPYARRAIWDLLTKHKEGRTMLLTTHFMDEADLLGDRIAIMAEGKLRCSGSSLFLKSRYGVGYHMVVVKEPSCNSAKVTGIVTSLVRGGKNVTDVGTELSYILPSNASHNFPQLFEALEARKSDLGIAGFGISVTTMEEVFIKVGEGTDETLEHRLERTGTLTDIPVSPMASLALQTPPTGTVQVHDVEKGGEAEVVVRPPLAPAPGTASPAQEEEETGEQGNSETLTKLTLPTPPKDFVPNSGIVLWFQQFCAMFLKRFYNTLRFWQAIFTQLLLPLLFVLFALILAVTLPNENENDPSRSLRISNSGLDPNNRIMFYAEFGDDPTGAFDFSNMTGRINVGETRFENYTGSTQGIINNLLNNTNSDDCCSYEYQLLDKFCAGLSKDDFDCSSSFGYNDCKRCLDCCRAGEDVPTSCSNPFTQFRTITPDNLCPAPPRLSYSDVDNKATGRLDSDLTYVDEYLIQRAKDLDPEVYIRRLQAGFVMSYSEPDFSACGLSQDTGNFNSELVNASLVLCRDVGADQLLVYDLNVLDLPFPWLNNEENCPLLQGSGVGVGEGSGSFGSESVVDGLSGNVIQTAVCTEEANGRTVAAYTSEFERTKIAATIYYNNNPWHMPGAALNAFHNVWLRQATSNDDLTLTINNHPLPRNAQAQVESTTQNSNGFSIAIMVVFGYSFLLASFVLFLVNEKETKAKHLQFVSGVDVTSYWLATFVWDMLNALIPVILTVILFACFQVDGFTGSALGAIFLILLLTCWATIPIVYTVSFLFTNSLVAFGLIVIALFLSAIIFLVVVLVLTDQATIDGLHYFFLLDPGYNLGIAVSDLYFNNIVKEACTSSEESQLFCDLNDNTRYVDNVFSTDRPGIGVNLVYFALEGIFFFILTLLIEYRFFIPEVRGLFLKNNVSAAGEMESGAVAMLGEDDDVAAERKKISTGATTESDVIVINNIVKVYRRRLDGFTLRPAKLAVQGISLSIPRSECFGLLGVNGAGKTTTFSMLTGDTSPTQGTAIISGYDIRTDLRKVQQRIGYCPQFDALIERMTGRELLTMFARLRGIPERLIKQAVEAEVARLDLTKHASKQCGKYSGGNKRKLSTALALVGNPPIVFLDEPTTGMDPATRRYLWDVLTGVTREGRSIVLTSHSMEECEALCTRLAIMVNGRFKCLGSIQHLKSKYGAGFYLQAKVKLSAAPVPEVAAPRKRSFRRQGSRQSSPRSPVTTTAASFDTPMSPERSITSMQSPISLGGGMSFNPFDTTALHIFIKESFDGAVLLEEHHGSVTYQLPIAGLTWASVFRQLEANKERLGIIDYSVSQTTLEQVFIDFAKEQQEEST